VVRVFGCPRLLGADGERVTGLRETALELLVYLVVRRDEVPQEAILRDVYAGASPQRASERFATDLANLRSRLRAAAGAGRTTNPVPRSRGRYRLLPDVVSADWWEVLDDWRVVKAAADERDVEAALRRITAAYADCVLADGAAYEWLADLQEQSRRLGVTVHVRLAELVAPRDQGMAAALLGRACDLDPFDEELARRTITAHLAAGDSAAAVARCSALREALAAIDESPEQETLGLVARVI
jgi:two-component SAPR family response regulator